MSRFSARFAMALAWSLLGVGASLAGVGLCPGDCGQDGVVRIDELVRSVSIALGGRALAECRAIDASGDGRVTVDELVQAVRASLVGCASTATPTTSSTPSPTARRSSTLVPTLTSTPSRPPSPSPTGSSTVTPTPTTPPPRRPNFIVIDLDDARADGLDRMPVVQARLVGEGVTFLNSFVPDSSCCPSRASLFSGLYALHHGTKSVSGPQGGADTFRVNRADRQTIAVWLERAGYRTALFGKYLNEYGVTEEDKGPGGTFYVPPGWSRWRAKMSPEHYGGIQGPTYTLVDERGQLTAYDDHTVDEQYSTDLLARELRTFVADAVSAGEPFFAVWAPVAPHVDLPALVPHPAQRHFGALLDLSVWRPFSWNEVDVSDKPRWVQTLRFGGQVDTFTDIIHLRAYRSLLAVDEQLGLTLDLLADLGVDRDTVVFLTSDNGACWGEHRYHAQGKGCGYEECIRVPMIVRYPRLTSQPATVEAAVLNIDVAPTTAALAGVHVPNGLDGNSFAPLLVGAAPWRERFLLERWRENRGDGFTYIGQVSDGDRLRLQYGPWRPSPRAAEVFEFDAGDGVGFGATAVAIGADEDASFANLGDAVVAAVPAGRRFHDTVRNALSVDHVSPDYATVHWIVEVDQGGVIVRPYPLPDYFGVRDAAHGYTYVEYETGEIELYDLNADPHQLENKADDPSYQAIRQDLAGTLIQLIADE